MIEVTNLTKKYGDHIAVDHLSFRVEKGQIYGFLGPNGAGKSTTMNIITGYLAATEGTVTIDGKDVQKDPEEAKRAIGYLPELPPLYVDMTVREYLDFVAELKKVPKKERKQQIDEVMEMTQITDMQQRLIRNLSKGYRQRVGLAQAILGYPEVIILDEPTVGLDPKQIIEIRDLIRKLGENHTVILSSHILRIWTADYLYPDKSELRSRLRFLISFDGIIDLLTILPFFFLSGMVIFRMLRVARIFHLFRLNARYDSFNVITTVLYEKRNQIISSVFIVLILMLASSLCMYSVEHDSQPEVFRNAFSGIWWSMSTLLTVGYGDIYPITTLGRIMAICIAYLGVGAVAIPTGIISAGFVEQYQRKSSLSNIKEADIHEIAEIFVDKRFAGKSVEEMEAAEQVTIFLILREDLSILPHKDTMLKLNDIIVIRGENP